MTAVGGGGGGGGRGVGGGGGGGGNARSVSGSSSFSTTIVLILLAVAFVLDFVGVIIVGSAPVSFDPVPLHWGSAFDFDHRAVDLVVLGVLRWFLLLLLLVPVRMTLQRKLAAAKGPIEQPSSMSVAFQQEEEEEEEDTKDGDQVGLLSTTAASHRNDATTIVVRSEGSPIGSSMAVRRERRQRREDAVSERDAYLQLQVSSGIDGSPEDEFAVERRVALARTKVGRIRFISLVIAFVLFTACNVYTSLKCLTFQYSLSPWEELSMALAVLWTNVQLACVRSYLASSTKDSDAQLPELHPHPLIFRHDVSRTKCDLCNARVIKEGFECTICDFDVCLECFRKKSAAHGVNLLSRGDKGANVQANADHVTPMTYILRGMRLILPFWHIVLLALICLVATQSIRVSLAAFQGKAIDGVVKNDSSAFWQAVKLYAALSTITLVLGSARSFCTMLVMRNVSFAVREKLFRSLIHRDIAFFDGATVGALTARMTNDAQAMVSPLNTLVNTVVANLITLVGSLFMCLSVSWRLAMISFTVIGPIVLITTAYAKWSAKLNRSVWDALAEANSNATEAFSNIRTVRAFSTERHEIQRFSRAMQEALSKTLRDAVAFAGAFFASNMLDLGSGMIILCFGGAIVMNDPNELSIGQLITFQLYANMMNGAYQALNGVLNQFSKSAGAAERVLAMLDGVPDIDYDDGLILLTNEAAMVGGTNQAGDEEGAGEGSSPSSKWEVATHPETHQPVIFTGELAFQQVSFRYQMRPDKQVLRDVTVTFPANQVTAIVGRSGGGKSTMIHLLLRYYDPSSGAVTCDGVDLRKVNQLWLHRRVAVVAQDTQLFNATIEENIRYGLAQGEEEELDFNELQAKTTTARPSSRGAQVSFDMVRDAAIRANAHDFISSFPDGYRTTVGERGVRLSGGQRQRIAIARAFLRKPRILLLDEATSALDAESEAQVQSALDTLVGNLRAAQGSPTSGSRHPGCTIVVVAHRLSTVVRADNILVMHEGALLEQGTHEQLLAKEGAYSQLVQRQLQSGSQTLYPPEEGAAAGDTTTAAAAEAAGGQGKRRKARE